MASAIKALIVALISSSSVLVNAQGPCFFLKCVCLGVGGEGEKSNSDIHSDDENNKFFFKKKKRKEKKRKVLGKGGFV